MIPRFSLFVASATLLAAASNAVITRHDVPAAAYAAHAAAFPSYCRLGVPDGGGALIAPQWVLTAAHLASAIKRGHVFKCGDEALTVADVKVHPGYDDNVGRHDLALIHLATASRQAPVALWPDAIAVGTVVELIGHYQGGTGLTGGVGREPAGLRGATNRVFQADDHWLRMVMDRPGSAAVTPLEGVSGAGDSGAPAFILRGATPFIVGVGSRSSDTNENGIEQDYGDTDLYVPVASYAGWIDRTVNQRESFAWSAADRWIDDASPRTLLGLLTILALAAVAVAASIRRRRLRD